MRGAWVQCATGPRRERLGACRGLAQASLGSLVASGSVPHTSPGGSDAHGPSADMKATRVGGGQVCEEVRRLYPETLPIIMISANTDEKSILHGLKARPPAPARQLRKTRDFVLRGPDPPSRSRLGASVSGRVQ